MGQSEYWEKFLRGRLSRRKALKGGLLAGAGLIGATAVGCGESSQPKPAATSTTATPTGAPSAPAVRKPQGKVSAIGTVPVGDFRDPHRMQHSLQSWRLWTDDLMMPGPNGASDRGLATSWTVGPDGLSWTFKLRKGVLFHDETEFTAEDVKFSFERQLKFPKSTASKTLDEFFDHAEIIDPYTVKIVLKRPEMALPVHLQTIARVLPKKYIEKVGDDYFIEHPIGTGPWKVVTQEPGIRMEHEAFEKHYLRVPYVKNLTVMQIPDAATQLAMLQSGDIDIIGTFGGVALDVIDQVKAWPGVQVLTRPNDGASQGRFCATQAAGKVWFDERVRKAFMYSWDREKMAKTFYKGLATPSAAMQLPLSFGYNPNLKPWPYDPAKAKQLMAEAGYPNGIDVAVYVSATYQPDAEAMIILLAAERLFRGKVVLMDGATWLAAMQARSLPLEPAAIWWRATGTGFVWTGDLGYEARTFHHSKGSWTYPMGDPKLDEMIDAQAVIVDVEKRRKALQDLFAYIWEHQLFVDGFVIPWNPAIGPRVKSWEPLNSQHHWYDTVQLKS